MYSPPLGDAIFHLFIKAVGVGIASTARLCEACIKDQQEAIVRDGTKIISVIALFASDFTNPTGFCYQAWL